MDFIDLLSKYELLKGQSPRNMAFNFCFNSWIGVIIHLVRLPLLDPLCQPRCRCKDDMKMDFMKMRTGLKITQDRIQ
jgi:hypothetical protein